MYIHTHELQDHVGKEVALRGFVHALRDQGKIVFINLRDHTGIIQVVVPGKSEDFETAQKLFLESVIEIKGVVKEAAQAPGGHEISLVSLDILSESAPELPIPVNSQKGGEETAAPLRFDFRWLDLRKPEKTRIFKVWTALEKGWREYLLGEDYIQLYPPALMGTASESGAEVFSVNYFETKAYLAQSPQFYKQMGMAAGLEKVFMTGPVFRAEPSFTTRHLTEFTGWDFEVSYVRSLADVLSEQEKMFAAALAQVKKEFPDLGIEVPTRPFPRLTIEEAKAKLKKAGVESPEEHDLSPEEEREISRIIKEEENNDFVFITDYHISKRPFYHMRHNDNSERTKSADLLYRGVEISTGAVREHRLEVLKKQAEEKGMDLESLKDYFNFFAYGCPPHGGAGIGPGRLVMKLLDLPNVREATYLPRDVKRLNP